MEETVETGLTGSSTYTNELLEDVHAQSLSLSLSLSLSRARALSLARAHSLSLTRPGRTSTQGGEDEDDGPAGRAVQQSDFEKGKHNPVCACRSVRVCSASY